MAPKSVEVITVPYHSQWEPHAAITSADCGETCALMIAQAYGKALTETVDDFVIDGHNQAGWTLASDLVKLLQMHDLNTQSSAINHDPPIPSICLVTYGFFTSRYDKGFTGYHWMVFLGKTDSEVIVHDPDWYGNGGENKHYPLTEWNQAYTGICVIGIPK